MQAQSRCIRRPKAHAITAPCSLASTTRLSVLKHGNVSDSPTQATATAQG